MFGLQLKNRQYASFSILGGALSATATITAVNVAQTVLIWTGQRAGAAGSPATTFTRVVLTNSTTITAYRNTAGAFITTVFVYVLEFVGLKSVQYGTGTIAAGTSSISVLINQVDLLKSIACWLGTTSTSAGAFDALNNHGYPYITDATHVACARSGTGAFSITIGFVVMEWY
jgi:hypothetical protein